MTGTSHEGEKITCGSCHCGAIHWQLRGNIPDATICNCTICRRYGVLWAYGYDGVNVHIEAIEGAISTYNRSIAFNFCKNCGNLVSWRSLKPDKDGKTRIAVNLRLAEPADVATIPLQRFDGLHTFDDLPKDGRTVQDVWF